MDAAELEWIAWTTPITTSLGAALAASDFSGRAVACRQHILADTICIVTPVLIYLRERVHEVRVLAIDAVIGAQLILCQVGQVVMAPIAMLNRV